MSVMRKILSRGRVRRARRDVAASPTAKNYEALAREYASIDAMDEVLRVCSEGLNAFPGHVELVRLAKRARQMRMEDRTRELYRELRESPRPAIWRELCDTLIEGGRVERAEECAEEWFQATQDGAAMLCRARARVERFFADRRRDDGRMAFEMLDAAEAKLPRDSEPLRVRLRLASRIGAWKEAQRVVSQLLELQPGDPVLEARFRTLLSLGESSPTPDQALREIERTGRLADDRPGDEHLDGQVVAVRPVLKALSSEPGVRAAVYVRGGTALVQGPKGATAERSARAVREMVHASRTAARRLGLGQASEIRLEGDFGSLFVAIGEIGSSAVWCKGRLDARHEQTMLELAGTALEGEVQA